MWIFISSLLWMVPMIAAIGPMKPDFDDQIVNVTVKEKTTAVLPCSVINLGIHQIVWTDQYSTLLTHEDRRIIDDDRLSVERPYNRDWNLHIRDVRYSDQGLYNCQINTEPIRIKMVYLNVLVPSKILENLSTRNVTIQEGEKVTLVCNATGYPQPTVTWFRLLGTGKGEEKQSELCPGSKQVGVDGEVLVIHNVTRYCGGNYQCVAYNGVSPAATRVIDVSVKFRPEVYLPNKRMGQRVGKDTILECTVSGHPLSDVWWERNGEKINSQDLKHRVDIYDEANNRLTLSLRIFNLEHIDFGVYTCYATNKLGGDHEDMILYDYNRHMRTTTTTTTTTPLPSTTLYYPRRKYPKYPQGGTVKVQERLYHGRDGSQSQVYSQGRGHSARPGSLTGNQGSGRQIYTPKHRHGNEVQPAQSKEGTGRSWEMRPNKVLLGTLGLVSSWLLTKSLFLNVL